MLKELFFMKLKEIKLAGFKSFVDATKIQLQSNLTGVVGPNGCGKSNIIDAVRWVMGEISAKQLRGESMTDVIFNGSSLRKPVGLAAVELHFDNSDASLGGEYAKYQEISIRREVDRNGFSDYYLNNTKCRRRDITDIFLGTGLGPNSYAIIEQGMISELIDAKPDDLRIYIEEAAGISKYKERRRETENRIKHTKENVNRLNDIRQEVDKQLKHLKYQANAAERYKKLKSEERLYKAQLLALNWHAVAQKLKAQEETIQAQELLLENKTTEQHTLDAKIAESREQHHNATDAFNTVQENFYHVGSNIARLEQQIQHAKERQEQLQRDLTQLNQAWQETVAHQTADQNQIAILTTEKNSLETEIISAREINTKATKEHQETEQEMQTWRNQMDAFNSNSAKILKDLEVEHTRIQHLEQRIVQETVVVEKLKAELANINFATLTAELTAIETKFNNSKAQHDALHNELGNKQQQITEQRENANQLAKALDVARGKLRNLLARQASLDTLQQTALGKNDLVLSDWLQQHNLKDKTRLAQELVVTPGWETAVETVLGNYLEAVCVENITEVVTAINTLRHGNLILVDNSLPAVLPATNATLTKLSEKISTKISLHGLLGNIYVAENLTAALAVRNSLAANESIITKDGIWLGQNWLRVAYDTNQKLGILQRERELHELHLDTAKEQNICQGQETELQQQQKSLADLEREHGELQNKVRTYTAEYSNIQSQLSAKKEQLHHWRGRETVLQQDINIHEVDLKIIHEQLAGAKINWQHATTQKSSCEAERNCLELQSNELQQRLTASRELVMQTQKTIDDLVLRIKLGQTQVEYLTESSNRAQSRLDSLKEHRTNIENDLAAVQTPLAPLAADLQHELEQRVKVETELTLAKQQVSAIEHLLREQEKQRGELLDAGEQMRTKLEQLRTERQGFQVRCTTYQEQITDLDFQLDKLLPEIPEHATIAEWEEKHNQVLTRIERLGPINLAAIDEFAKLQERQTYLEAQNADLVNALNTLESAIHKIDNETKERFRATFADINSRFQDLFPKIFAGGKASLEQTGDNILDTGVLIMAQPPGKRNSTIHLLSGGEKALTAIALLFSIFQLNPAPFCMLDEVDAPLDDLNVSRFCNLVKEMSQSIQFIFVTHNKLTMEIAQQLAGITMHEAGVSRMVSVDIDTAINLARN